MPTAATLDVLIQLNSRGFASGLARAQRQTDQAVRTLRQGTLNLGSLVNRLNRTQASLSSGFKLGIGFLAARGFASGLGNALDVLKQMVGQAAKMRDLMTDLAKPLSLDIKNPADAGFLDDFRKQLQQITRQVPGATFEDAADIATSGAKANVSKEELADYTRGIAAASVVIKDVPAGELADKILIIGGAFKIGADQSIYMASAIDKLGDSSKASAADILEVGKRAAAAANQVGLSVKDMLAFATAAKDSGIETEAAGGALSRVFNKLALPDNQKGFSKLLGTDQGSFKARLNTDGFGLLLDILDKIRASGKDAALVLQGVGIRDVREVNLMQALANKIEDIKRFQQTANHELRTAEFLLGSAANAATKYENQQVLLGESFKAISYAVGGALLPALNATAQHVGILADEWADAAEKSSLLKSAAEFLTKAMDLLFEAIRDPEAAFKILSTAFEVAGLEIENNWRSMLARMAEELKSALADMASIAAKTGGLAVPGLGLVGMGFDKFRKPNAPDRDPKAELEAARASLLAQSQALIRKGEDRRAARAQADIKESLPRSTGGMPAGGSSAYSPLGAGALLKPGGGAIDPVVAMMNSGKRDYEGEISNRMRRFSLQRGDQDIKTARGEFEEMMADAKNGMDPAAFKDVRKRLEAQFEEAIGIAEDATEYETKRRGILQSGQDQVRDLFQNRALDQAFDQLERQGRRQVSAMDAESFKDSLRDGINSTPDVEKDQLDVLKQLAQIGIGQTNAFNALAREFGELGAR